MTPLLRWRDLWVNASLLKAGASATALPVSLPAAHCRYTFNGSAAIDAALEDMQLHAGASVLLPAWCCDAELGPFEHRGCQMGFYDVDPDGSVPAMRLARRLQAQPAIQVVLITHYNGIVQADIEQIGDLCRRHEVSLIENCSYALYSELKGRPVGSWGTHAVFSMRKSVPLSEGGALTTEAVLREHINQASPMSLAGRSSNLKPASARAPSTIARWSRMAWSFQQGARSGSSSALKSSGRWLTIVFWALPALLSDAVRWLKLLPEEHWLTPDVEAADAYPVYAQGMSLFSQRLLFSSDGEAIRKTRREHHAYWVSLVQDMPGVEPLYHTLPDGACPLYFFLRVANPLHCVRALAEEDIETFNWWHCLSPQIVWSQFPVARQLKQSLLALPVHQHLSMSDIQRMAACLSATLSQAQVHEKHPRG